MLNKITIWIGIVVILLIALGGVYVILNKATNNNPDEFAPPKTFNPFGIFGDNPVVPPTNTGTSTDTSFEPTEFTPALRHIANRSASDVVLVGTGTTTKALFVERETGHIFSLDVTTGSLKRLTNTTIPRIQEALFSPSGENVVLRYLRDDGEIIETFVGDVPLYATTTDSALIGDVLPQNITSVAWNPDGTELFYLNNGSSGSFGTRYTLKSKTKKSLFSSPLTEWLVSWPQDSFLFLTTKASGLVPGHMFRLSTGGVFTKIFGGSFGLTALPGPETNLITARSGSSLRSFLYDKNGVETDLSIDTLADKCGWDGLGLLLVCGVPKSLPGATLPDDWYRGAVSFNDRIWAVDPTSGTLVIVADPKTYTDTPLDVVNVSISEDGLFVVFINKTDSAPWVIDVVRALGQ